MTSRPPANRASAAAEHRTRVLARRRTALIVLGVAVVVTLAAAILTGSWPILAVSLVADVALAAYIAILLQIKQRKAVGSPPDSYPDFESSEDDIRVRSR